MELTLAVILGLVIGSFLNVCILRIPLEVPITSPRSHCPHCKKLIHWYDNVPVLSYLILRGRCRHCKKKISARYPLIELISGLLGALVYFKFGFGVEWVIFFGFAAALLVMAFIDMDHRILPDVITLNGIWIGVLASLYLAGPNPLVSRILRAAGFDVTNPRVLALVGSLLGVIVGGGLLWGVGEAYLRLRGIEGMGFGDVKMMAMVGAFLGAPMALFTIMLGSLLGAVVGLAFMRFTGKSRDYELPFGTFLGIAGIVAILYGDELIRLYFEQFIQPAL